MNIKKKKRMITLILPLCFFFPPFLSFFSSAVQLDSCGSQDSCHPEHQDGTLRCHEQRGLPLHFGMVITNRTAVPLKLGEKTLLVLD